MHVDDDSKVSQAMLEHAPVVIHQDCPRRSVLEPFLRRNHQVFAISIAELKAEIRHALMKHVKNRIQDV